MFQLYFDSIYFLEFVPCWYCESFKSFIYYIICLVTEIIFRTFTTVDFIDLIHQLEPVVKSKVTIHYK